MTRTQIQLPETLYRDAKALAAQQEISLAELVRHGLEYMLRVSALPTPRTAAWALPEPVDLGATDPFANADWRHDLHVRQVADPGAAYNATPRGKGKT